VKRGRAFLCGILLFTGGLTLGIGLLMIAQIELLESLRNEADKAGSFWRGLGHLTFGWQDDTTQTALWAHEMPTGFVSEARVVAWVWLGVGFVSLLSVWWIEPHDR
jgi:hypothetical protein